MSLSARLAGATAAAAAAALLLLPGAAYARAGDLTFQQAYPRASRLCTDISLGVGHALLRKSAPQVLTDCAVLANDFNEARIAVIAAHTSIRAARTSLRANTLSACKGHPRSSACARARRKERRTGRVLTRQHVKAAHLYYSRVEGDRAAFWREIHKLRGGAREKDDQRILLQDS